MSMQQPTPGYGPQYPAVYAVKPPYLGITIVSLCFGIAAVVFAWIPYIGMILGAVAVVCGHVAMRQLARSLQPRSGKGLAIAGLITGYAGILFSIIGILILMAFTSALNSSFS